MVLLDFVNLPSVLLLSFVASGLSLIRDAIRLPQSRRSFPSDAPADLIVWFHLFAAKRQR